MLKNSIPNILTLLNLLFGVIAIMLISHQMFFWAGFFVMFAAIFDFFDGFAARLLKVSGELGKQLDSLADMVSFGVVPGFAMFTLLKISFYQYDYDFFDFSDYHILVSKSTIYSMPGFLITLFSALRLAKFNIDTRQAESFIGVPTPAVTLFVFSLLLISQIGDENIFITALDNSFVLLFLSLLLSYALVAELPLFAMKFKDFSWHNNQIRYIFIALSIILIVFLKIYSIPLIIVLYVLLSMIQNIRK